MKRRSYSSRQYRLAKKRIYGQPCELCGVPADTIDHIVPIALGGTDDSDNLRPLCRRCNSTLGGRVGQARSKARRRRVGRRW